MFQQNSLWACQNGARGALAAWCGQAHRGPAMPSTPVEMEEIGLLLPMYPRDEELHAGSCRIRVPDGDLLSSWLFNEHSS